MTAVRRLGVAWSLSCRTPRLHRRKVIYDNGYHHLDYMLSRDPELAKSQHVMIDELHAKGQTSCASSFDTGVFLFGEW
jgi:hypothetical protein